MQLSTSWAAAHSFSMSPSTVQCAAAIHAVDNTEILKVAMPTASMSRAQVQQNVLLKIGEP